MEDLTNILKLEFPDKAIDLSESLQLLKEVINSTIDDISSKVGDAFIARDFESIDKYTKLAEKGSKYEDIIEKFIDLLELENEDNLLKSEDESSYIHEQQSMPNYEEFQVDNSIEHALFEDFMYKRPFGFKFVRNNIYEASSWNEVLIKTCEIFYDIDKEKFNDLEYLPHMNGKKRKHFAQDPKELRKPEKIKDGIFVETNHSANTIRNIIVKLLKEYKFKISDYKIYLRADYTELNKNYK